MERSTMRRLAWNLGAAALMFGAFFVGGFALVVGIIVVFLLNQLISAVERVEEGIELLNRRLALDPPGEGGPGEASTGR